jgi:glycosyltransferase involved in cell wall biosynthesis
MSSDNGAGTTERRAPLVSIGLPVFNGEATIKQALGSLIGQDYPNIEIIVSDNASTDRTVHITKRVLKKHPNYQVVEQPENRGPHANFAAVLEKAKGDYFMWAADDDVWKPQFVSRLVAELEAHPEACVAMCATDLVDQAGRRIDTIRFKDRLDPNPKGPLAMGALVLTPYKFNYFIYGLYRTALLRKGIRYWPHALGGDRMFVAQFAFGRRFRYLDEVHYRRTYQPAHRLAYQAEEARTEAKVAQVAAFSRMIAATKVLPAWRKLGLPFYAALYAGFVFRKDIGRTRDQTMALGRKLLGQTQPIALSAAVALAIALAGALSGVAPSGWVAPLSAMIGLLAIGVLALQHRATTAELRAARKDMRQLRDLAEELRQLRSLVENERSEANTNRYQTRKALGGVTKALEALQVRFPETAVDGLDREINASVRNPAPAPDSLLEAEDRALDRPTADEETAAPPPPRIF